MVLWWYGGIMQFQLMTIFLIEFLVGHGHIQIFIYINAANGHLAFQ